MAIGVLADLAAFPHVLERHHADSERWFEAAVQRRLWRWEGVAGGMEGLVGSTGIGIGRASMTV